MLSALLTTHVVTAQVPDDSNPVAPKPGPKAQSILKDGTLDPTARLYLESDGKPILLPSESMESYLSTLDALKQQQSSRNSAPSYVLDFVSIEANVAGNHAQIVGSFNVSLSSNADAVAAIPLRFDSCQLSEVPLFTGEASENLLEVRPSGAGYQWYLRAPASSKHSAKLTGSAIVATQGDRKALRLALPLAPSSLVIKLPPNAIDDDVRGPGEEVVTRESTQDAVLLRIQCQGGELDISWRDADARTRLSAIEAASQSRIEIEDPTLQPWKISSDVTLRWFGDEASDSVEIALPAGARWLQTPTSVTDRYSVTVVQEQVAAPEKPKEAASDATTAATGEAQRLTIRNLHPSLMQPIDLHLEWEWRAQPTASDGGAKPITVPSITIGGVDAHTGTVEILIPTSFTPTWQEQTGTKLVQQTRSTDAFDRNQFLFRFSRQPLHLTADFRRPSSVASIRPTYLAHLDGNKMQLTGWLDCTFDTTQPIAVTMLPSDWQIESAELADITSPHATGDPLALTQQGDGSTLIAPIDFDLTEFNEQRRLRQVWRVIAYRPWEPDANQQFTFKLPAFQWRDVDGNIKGFDHGTGVLIVTSSDNLLLKNEPQATSGLLIDSLVPQWQPLLDSDSKSPLVYRFQSRGQSPVWTGKVESLPQQIVLQQQAVLNVLPDVIRVSQEYSLQIVNEPLNQLRLAIRQDALNQGDPQVSINGVPVILQPINELDASSQSNAPATTPAMTISMQNGSATKNSATTGATTTDQSTPPQTAPTDSSNMPADTTGTTANPSAAAEASQVDSSNLDSSKLESGKTASKAKPAAEKPAWRIFTPVSVAPLRGSVTVNVQTDVPWSTTAEQPLAEVSAPLVQLIVPRQTRLREQTWSVKANRELEVLEGAAIAPNENGGDEAESTSGLNVERQRLISATNEPRELNVGQAEVLLSVRKLESMAYSPVRVGRSWLQTTINGTERRDRYCAQIESSLPRLSIRIPSNRNLKYVIIDGKRTTDELTAVFIDDGTQYQIDFPDSGNSENGLASGNARTRQIEIWMSSSESLSWFSPLNVDIPEIEGAQFYDRFYWQIAVPSIQHLGFASARMTPEWVWKWKGLWWHRDSQLRQSDLERWVGATQQTEMPLTVNSYVLSSFGGGRSFEVWLLSRFMLWLPIGLLSIVFSILLISFRALRHPAFLLLSAGGLATAAMLAPDFAVLLGQSALVSLGLVGLILVTQAAIDSRVRRRSVFAVRPSHFSNERSDNASMARSIKVANPPSSTRAHSSVIADGGK